MPFRVPTRNTTWLVLVMLGGLSPIGCGSAPTGPIKPAPPLTAEERREFEERFSAVLAKEREQRKQEQLRPIVSGTLP